MPRGETSNCFVLVGLNGIWDETDVVYPTPDGTSSDVARFPNTEMDEGDEFKVV